MWARRHDGVSGGRHGEVTWVLAAVVLMEVMM